MTKIVCITIENYRPFYGTNRLSFSTDSCKNFNVVYAGTGSGKTSILDGISWCLYGKELHKQPGKKDKRDSLLNEKKLDELDKSQTADV